MARSRSAILSVDARSAIRDEKKALRAQLKEAKATEKDADRALKAAFKARHKLEDQISKLDAKVEAHNAAKAAA